jgi:hypothetical protein
MKKVTLTVQWGHFDPIKNAEKKHSLLQCIFPPNNILQHGLCSHIDKWTRLCWELSNIQKQIQKYTENVLQNPNNIAQRYTCQFLTMSHTVSLSVALCLSLYVMLRSARHRTAQKISILHGRYCGVHLTPSGNKDK